MANVKMIQISGKLPFNCDQHHGMLRILGQLNAPSSGLKIKWLGNAGYVENSHGGKTTMYHFEISGQEAVSNKWFEAVLQSILDCGGDFKMFSIVDVENGYAKQPIDIPKKRNNVFYYTVEANVDGNKLEPELVNQYLGEYMGKVISSGVQKNSVPSPISTAIIDTEKWSVRPA